MSQRVSGGKRVCVCWTEQEEEGERQGGEEQEVEGSACDLSVGERGEAAVPVRQGIVMSDT
ncbi:hypothetical protein E2C01_041646 [Portunus trituberculatus]|uniref:Uncharacterized protein n=1 Tax=Portunus trituberculatus TaxID=210409 RepID=A0A5B7FR76_PORTR|nr:hypothetical protein [Portunus trituberculatus]